MTGSNGFGRIGWVMVLIAFTALYGALHLRVNAVKSEVRLAERRIVSLQQETVLLETEFQTRSNQRQLATWNDVEFGYSAPRPGQFLEGERELAQFGTPRVPGSPEPIMVASAPQQSGSPSFAEFLSPPAMAASEKLAEGSPLARGAARVASGGIAGAAE